VHPRRRRKRSIGRRDRPCGMCGERGMTVTESRAVRRGAAWLNPRWDAAVRVYARCDSCGARHDVDGLGGDPAAPGARVERGGLGGPE
jgi:hypothetical protein